MQWEPGTKDGRQHWLSRQQLGLNNTQRGLGFFLLEGQSFTNLISGYFSNALEITTKTHPVFLDLFIT